MNIPKTPGQRRRMGEAIDKSAKDAQRYAKFDGMTPREVMDWALEKDEWARRTNNSREALLDEMHSLRQDNMLLRRQVERLENQLQDAGLL